MSTCVRDAQGGAAVAKRSVAMKRERNLEQPGRDGGSVAKAVTPQNS